MRRRDEPKLDDLKKLLRRLESIGVDSSLGGSGTSQEQQTGYVGALRGAPVAVVAEAEPVRPSRAFDSLSYGADEARTASKPRSTGMASIVIGAATAAIVSSLAVGVLLLAGGGQSTKVGPTTRLPASGPQLPALGAPMNALPSGLAPFGQPATPSPARAEDMGVPAPSPTPPEQAPQSSEVANVLDTGALVKRAELLIIGGNLAEARQLLERAAGLGSATAALMLGATYDPARMDEFGRLGARADAVVARAWYERARALGAAEATDRITELAKR